MKKILSVILCVIILSVPVCAFADDDILADTARLILSSGAPSFGYVGGEWAVTGIARSGVIVPDGYFDAYYDSVEKYTAEHGGVLHQKKYTEYSRVIIALTAIGKNPENVGGYNLLEPLGDYNNTVWQGINGSVFALIALDCGNYAMPENGSAEVMATREMYIEHILSKRTADGGWAFSGKSADPDMTAMAITALSKYRERENVNNAIETALSRLSEMQNENGGFASGGTESAESAAQVLVALSELGITDDPRFVKSGHSVYDNMIGFYIPGAGFCHQKGDLSADTMATEQCFYALAAYKRALNGENGLFDIAKTERSHFSDVIGTQYRREIDALYKHGIVKGMTEYTFIPGGTLTRAQLASLIVGALELKSTKQSGFADVSSEDWFCNAVSAAYENNIIMGESGTSFNPNGKVTRAEAAVMLMRAAGKKGYDIEGEASAPYADVSEIPEWALSAAAFCAGEGIMPDFGANFSPSTPITRAEAAYMLCRMLKL